MGKYDMTKLETLIHSGRVQIVDANGVIIGKLPPFGLPAKAKDVLAKMKLVEVK